MYFDIALSFAGEDRAIAKELAQSLKRRGLKVFYDDEQQAELIGENLTEYLTDIYQNRASYCVVLVSGNYVRKRWARHEWRAAQSRAFEQFDKAYILPVRLDESELPGLLPTTGYISLEQRTVDEIAELLAKKVEKSAKLNRVYRIADAAFQRGDFNRVIELLGDPKFHSLLQKNHGAYRLLADSKLKIGDVLGALEDYEEINKHQPSDAEAWFQKGVCCARLGRYLEAEAAYEKTLSIAPHHTTAESDLVSVREKIRSDIGE